MTAVNPTPTTSDTTSGFPTNKIVAFAGPYIAVISGVVADWLFVHVHFLSIFHTNETAVSSYLTQATVFGITAVLTWAGHHKWLTGWQNYEAKLLTGQLVKQVEVEAEKAIATPTRARTSTPTPVTPTTPKPTPPPSSPPPPSQST